MKKNILRRALPLVLAAVLMIPLFEPLSVTPVSAKVTQQDIDKLKSDANDLASQKKELASQLSKVRADKSKAQDRKSLIEQQINVIQSEINNYDAQIQNYATLIGEKEVDLAETQQKEAAQYELFCKRVRSMEEDGEVSYWSILFSSSDFSDLLDNFMMVEEIMQYDNGVMESLVSLREQIEADKAALESAKADKESARQAKVAAKQDQEAKQAEVDKLIDEISADEDALEAQEAQMRKEAAAIDAEIKKKQKELASQISNVVSESGFLWPLSGYNTLSSLYGSRIHPLTGKANNHTGIDIPAPKGTSILASKSGVVVTSAYNNSYGNYVVVAHSDGTSTLYAHMSKRNVSEKQTVKQGAVVGYVGSTGSSTGNHLHFEIRVNGVRKDPVNYFKSKTLYVTYKGQKVQLKH